MKSTKQCGMSCGTFMGVERTTVVREVKSVLCSLRANVQSYVLPDMCSAGAVHETTRLCAETGDGVMNGSLFQVS